MTWTRDNHVISNLELKESNQEFKNFIKLNHSIYHQNVDYLVMRPVFAHHVIKDHMTCHKGNHMELSDRQRQETRAIKTINISKRSI